MLKFKVDKFIFYIILLSTFYILIFNIFHYSPILGYDGEAHFNYVDFMAMYLPNKLVLPLAQDTREFFSPPVGYLFPSLAQVVCRNVIISNNFASDCQPIYGKATQVFQSVLYIVTLLINLYTLKLFNRSKSLINSGYLLLLSLLAVNYRTLSMIRGEPYILFFMSIFILIIYKFSLNNFEYKFKNILFTGVIIALLALSRQWAFLLFLPIIILAVKPKLNFKFQHFKFWLSSSLIGALFSSWFYFNLYFRYGSFTSFNQAKPPFSFKNQPFDFYFPTIKQIDYIFTSPIRPFLDNQFFGILYADLWGDYWGYFSFTSRFLDVGRNQLLIGSYFSRVNVISIFTTLLIIIFCYLSVKSFKNVYLVQFLKLAIFSSFFGYLMFSISFPENNGDTIKASYIIQLFHLAVFLASIYFQKLKTINLRIYKLLLFFLTIIYIHNYQTYLSHFPINFYP